MNEMNMEILKIDVKINDTNVSLDLSQDMLIDVSDINKSYLDQPSKYAYWATLAALARSKANKMKQQLDKEQDYLKTTLTGTLDAKVRNQLELDGEKITESKVTNAIYTNPEYIAYKTRIDEMTKAYLDADEQARLLEVGRATLDQRKEMLISLGAQLRSDFDGNSDLSVKDVSSIVGEGKRARRKAIVSD